MNYLLKRGLLLIASIFLFKGACYLAYPILNIEKRDELLWASIEDLDFNAYIVGSSRVRQGLNPYMVDKYANGIRSYCFGIPAYTQPNSLFFFKRLIEEGKIDDKLVLIEYSGPNASLTYPHVWLKSVFSQVSDYQSFINASYYFYDYLSQNIYGLLSLRAETTAKLRILPIFTRGFSSSKVVAGHLSSEITDANIAAIEEESSEQLVPDQNIIELLSAAEQHNVTVLFFRSPTMSLSELKMMSSRLNAIPSENRLDMPKEAMEKLLSDPILRKNDTHFNVIGARKFSALFGSVLNEKLLEIKK